MITIHTKTITEFTAVCYDIVDITAKLKERIRAVGMRNGTATLFVNGSTAALTTIEYEPGPIQDLKEFLEKYIPADRRYRHDDRWNDDNGFAICAPRYSGRRWRSRSSTARPVWGIGRRLP